MAPKTLQFVNHFYISRLLIITTFLAILQFHVFGQWFADFSENSLSDWHGDTLDFRINSQQRLQLNAPEGKLNSILFRKIDLEDPFSLALELHLDFDPSSTNNLEVFFATDTLRDELTGYGIAIGQNGNQDAIDFILSDGANRGVLFSGPPGMVATGPVNQRIVVEYSSYGHWKCFADGGDTFIGQIIDTTLAAPSLRWLRIICNYSASRRDKFQFDNIHAGNIPKDTIGPVLSLSILDSNHLSIHADEPLDTSWLQSLSAFFILPSGNGYVEKVPDHDSIVLISSFAFVEGVEYMLLVDSIRDKAGNYTSTPVLEFLIPPKIAPALNDVIISEVMFDPSPPVWLPETEYIEIYNRSNKSFQLDGWKVTTGNSTRNLPPLIILPNQFALLCDSKDVELFPDSILRIGISSFPALPNQGATLQLLSNSGSKIFSIEYSAGLHTDEARKNGGYSIELTHPNALCDPTKTWHTSNATVGGTPGYLNSEWLPNADTTGPGLVRVAAIAPHSVLLEFDEKINFAEMLSSDNYLLHPTLTIDSIYQSTDRIIILETVEEIEKGIIYIISPFNAWDCMNNASILDSDIAFTIAQNAVAGELVINELMVDPKVGGSRFIEIYNPTNHPIVLQTVGFNRGSFEEPLDLCQVSSIIEPGEFVVFCEDKRKIENEFKPPYPDRIFECELPSFDRQFDFVGLFVDGILVDSVSYTTDWHHPILKETKGISLEKTDPTAPASLSSSWKSCADPLQGTPGRKNSSVIPAPTEPGSVPWFEKNVFSPDQDGFDDLLIIHLPETLHHAIVNAWMLDTDGKEIIQWVNNEFVAGRRYLTWDGIDKNGQIAGMGIYIAYLQFWSSDGDVHTFRLPCALVTR